MPFSFSLVAKLRFPQVRNKRVARRIESLSDTTGPAEPPVASVFRRIAPAIQPTIVARGAGCGLRQKPERTADAPSVRSRAPANENARSTLRVRRLVS